ncbi:cytochrome P450 [Georgenia alba]|uniref:Cytochrome P450 n=1 Tax=Georgenia alba TaxID=2233858 RepID=A0ABW2QB61_9MICO
MSDQIPPGGCPVRDSEWDPTEPETFGSAQVTYARLRRDNPFPWSEAFGGFWSATTYDDVVAIARDTETFSTATQNVVPHVPRTARRPPLHYDPPEQTAFREVIDPSFRRAEVKALEPRFTAAAETLLDPWLAHGACDYAQDVAMPYVAQCFAEYLRVPTEVALRVREIGVRYAFAIQDMDKLAVLAASDELYAIARDLYDADDPGTLVRDLRRAATDPDNAVVTEQTAVATVRQLIVAGMGAPQAVLGSAVAHLAQDPNLQDRLRRDRALLPAAVEELLRLYAPYRVFARTANRDVEVRGRLVRAGEPITLIYPSANRDETRFDDVDTFRLDRRPNKHLAFGRGAHRCPAASMGRSELVIALDVLLTRTASFGLDGEVEMMNWLEFGPRSVPLRLVPATEDAP